jgi:hypothetical protein
MAERIGINGLEQSRVRVKEETETTRGMMVLLVLLVIMAVAGCGGGGPSKVTVTGHIVDQAEMGLKGAAVTLGGGSATSAANGAFSLASNSGAHVLAVSKSGFATLSQPVSVSGSALNLGSIKLTQSIPTGGGDYKDSSVWIPPLANGQSFGISGSSDHPAYLMLFPQTETSGNYPYVLTVTDAVFSERAMHKPSNEQLHRSAVRTSADARSNQGANWVDDFLRRKERESVRHRADLLKSLYRVRGTALAQQIGDERIFNTIDFTKPESDPSWIRPVTGVLRRIGTHADIYVDKAISLPAALEDWGAFFDSVQPTLASVFGRELDVDGNGKIVVLITPIPAPSGIIFGYFFSANELPKSSVSYSNECDMIVINPVAGYEQKLKGTLAHEYQHLVHYSERITNGEAAGESWITEAFSTLAEDLVGYGYLSTAGEADATPVNNVRVVSVQDWLRRYYQWSLTAWDGENYSYGAAYLFGRYLYDQYGAAKVLEINRSAYGGTRAVTDAVGGTFGELFRSWIVAVLNEFKQHPSPDSRLNYGPEFKFDPSHTLYMLKVPESNNLLAGGVSLRPWGLDIIKVPVAATISPSGLTPEANYGGVVVKY